MYDVYMYVHMYVCMYVRVYICVYMYVYIRTYVGYVRTHICKYVLTPRIRLLLGKLTVPQLVTKFRAFYGTRRSITAVTSACHLFLSLGKQICQMLFILCSKVWT